MGDCQSFSSACLISTATPFEFREPSWFTDQIYELLKKHHAALCVYHLSGYDSPAEVTADFVYLRFHGTESTYGGSYSKSQLRLWARRIRAWRDDGKAVFVYFNNDPEAHAVYNAKTLRDLLRSEVLPTNRLNAS